MSHYLYRCFNCDGEYSISEIEDHLLYLCPDCGENKKNQPLKGVLEIIYDYKSLRSDLNKDSFLKLEPGKFWLYPMLWPLEINGNTLKNVDPHILDSLSLNSQFISKMKIDGSNVLIFDDSRNPTLSYKDRASILVGLKAIQLRIDEISTASTGNAGSSLAGICARLGLKSNIFVPRNIPENKRIQMQAFGANVYYLDGDYDLAFDLCLEISNTRKWYNRNTGYNPLTIEGKKSSVYDMYIRLNGVLPQHIFVSAGDGVIISGIHKGLAELQQLELINEIPKLVIVQSKGSDAIVRYIETGEFIYKQATTIADSICSGAPRNLYMAARAVRETNGYGISVTDEEILVAQKLLAENGYLCEPAAAASMAGYLNFKKSTGTNPNDSLIMLTGNGLKDLSSLKTWNGTPLLKTYEEIIELLS